MLNRITAECEPSVLRKNFLQKERRQTCWTACDGQRKAKNNQDIKNLLFHFVAPVNVV